jgi:hypothetical protein
MASINNPDKNVQERNPKKTLLFLLVPFFLAQMMTDMNMMTMGKQVINYTDIFKAFFKI